jgi:hypothetical protein
LIILKHLHFLLIFFFFQGCGFHLITTYENCVSPELTFEFKDNKKLCLIDDSKAKRKYSSLGIAEGEYYFSTEDCKPFGNDGYDYIPLKVMPFHLTGVYKINTPKGILGMFISEISHIQADYNGTKVWMSLYDFEEYYHKDYVQEDIKKLKEKSELAGGWHLKFKCPNQKARIAYWSIK